MIWLSADPSTNNKRGTQVGSDKTPNELYVATGEAGDLQLAVLARNVKAEGPRQM